MAGRILPVALATIVGVSIGVATFDGEFKKQRIARLEEEYKRCLLTPPLAPSLAFTHAHPENLRLPLLPIQSQRVQLSLQHLNKFKLRGRRLLPLRQLTTRGQTCLGYGHGRKPHRRRQYPNRTRRKTGRTRPDGYYDYTAIKDPVVSLGRPIVPVAADPDASAHSATASYLSL